MSSFEMGQRTSKILLLLLAVAVVGATCHHREPEMVSIGPDVQYGLAVYFKPDTTHDQIESFLDEVPMYPTKDGHWTRPGVSGILRLAAVQGHEAVAIGFFPNATQAERDDIKSRVRASPVVYKVLENVVPQNIKKLD